MTTLTKEQIIPMTPHQVLIHQEAKKKHSQATVEGDSKKILELWNSIMVRVSMGKEVRWKEDVQLTLHLLQKEGVNVDAFSARVSIKPEFV